MTAGDRIVVLAPPELAAGFRLAGASVSVVAPGPEVAGAVRQATGDLETGLLLVTADLWAALDERTRDGLEQLARPVVLAIPAAGAGDRSAGRWLLGQTLQRAIGHRVVLRTG